MSKKDKKEFALAEDFQSIITLVPKLEALIDAHKEIAAGYQKYRKSGGEAISGIEKHLGIKVQESGSKPKTEKAGHAADTEAPEEKAAAKKNKKPVKK
jgi:hypothetical protein